MKNLPKNINLKYLSTFLLIANIITFFVPTFVLASELKDGKNSESFLLSNNPENSSIKNQDLANLDNTALSSSSQTMNVRLVIKISQRKVYVYNGDKEIANYPIAVGKKGWETPKGNFKVIEMFEDPSWEHPWNGTVIGPGPENPLGDRWIGFWTDGKNYIGFHGTPAEQLVGQAVSHGCIRMRNNDVRKLFQQVRVGTPVIVVN